MIYLDNAATSRKKPFCVKFAVLKELFLCANAGRAGHRAGLRAAMKTEETRAIIRNTFFDGTVVFTKSCTEALNLAMRVRLNRKRVLTDAYEHNAVLRPLKAMEKEGKIRLSVLSPKPNFAEAFFRAGGDNLGMVVLSGMSNVTGEEIPYEEIFAWAKKQGAITVLDGAQTVGKRRRSYENVDMLAAGGHKGLHGIQGTGFLLMRKGLRPRPLVYGGTGDTGTEIDLPSGLPESLEAGTSNMPGIVALGKGIEYTYRHLDGILKKEECLTNLFCKILTRYQEIEIISRQNGIVLLRRKKGEQDAFADLLSDRYGICVRSGRHCAPLIHREIGTEKEGAIRASFGRNNGILQTVLAAHIIGRTGTKSQ